MFLLNHSIYSRRSLPDASDDCFSDSTILTKKLFYSSYKFLNDIRVDCDLETLKKVSPKNPSNFVI